jgi:hypothetical protein
VAASWFLVRSDNENRDAKALPAISADGTRTESKYPMAAALEKSLTTIAGDELAQVFKTF